MPLLTVTVGASHRSLHVYDKRFPCIYCGKMLLKISRHVLEMHKTEQLVMKARELKPQDKERDAILSEIRKEGCFRHNSKVLTEATGELIVERRPREKNTRPEQYRPCTKCKGFYHKTNLSTHIKACGDGTYDRRDSEALYAAMRSKANPSSIQRVLNQMVDDDIKDIAEKDDIIRAYGEALYTHHYESKETLVSTKMREISKLVKEVRLQSRKPTLSIREIITPEFFDTILKSTRVLCRFDPMNKSNSIPSLALKIGHALKKCAALISNAAIRQKDRETENTIESYLKLHNTEWHTITRYALDAREVKKTAAALPLTEDLQVNLVNGLVNILYIYMSCKFVNTHFVGILCQLFVLDAIR